MKEDGQPAAAGVSPTNWNRPNVPQAAPASGRILVLVILIGVVVYYFCFLRGD